MRVIITGGSGLIGRALTASLVADGHEAIILSRDPQRADGLPAGARVVAWDGETAAGWGDLVEGAGAVVNLAGASIGGEGFFPRRWSKARKALLLSSRLKAGKAVSEAVEAAGQKPGAVVQASAIGYYGPLGSEPVDESAPPGDDFLARMCIDWEASTVGVEGVGVRRVIARTGVVLSMRGGAFPRLLLPFKLFAGGPMGNGRQYLSWIHMADEVAAMRFLIENQAAEGVFNLTASHPITNGEFAKILGGVMGRPSFIPVPGFAMRLAFGEVATVVVDGQRVLPKRLMAQGFTFRFAETEPAVRELLKK